MYLKFQFCLPALALASKVGERMHGQQPVEHTLLRGWIAARFAAAFVFLLIALFGLLIAPQPNFVVWALAVALVAGAVILIANSWRGQRNCVLNCHGIRWGQLARRLASSLERSRLYYRDRRRTIPHYSSRSNDSSSAIEIVRWLVCRSEFGRVVWSFLFRETRPKPTQSVRHM